MALLALIAVVCIAGTSSSPASAQATPDVPAAALPGPGDEIIYSELDVPQLLELDTSTDPTDLRLLDELTGTAVQLREVTRDGTATRVVIPRLPVGRYRIETRGADISVRVDPEGGSPIELDAVPSGNHDATWIVLSIAVFSTAVVALRARRRAISLVLLTALLSGGLVSVTLRSEVPLATSWEQCDAYTDDQQREQYLLRRDCKVRYLVSLLDQDQTSAIAGLLQQEQDLDCHEIAHLTGFYYYRSTQDLGRASKAMILGCSDGMVHGVLESMSVYMDDGTFASELGDLCASLPDTPSQRTCYHGSGHATLWRTNGNLYDAWAVCDLTRDVRDDDLRMLFRRITVQDTTYSSRAECRAAAIMEWGDRWESERTDDGADGLTPQLDEPMDLCRDNLSDIELFEAECYLGSNYRTADPVKAAARCNEVARWVRSCFMVVGDNFTQFAGRIHQTSAPTLHMARTHAGVCLLARDERAGEQCLEALANTAIVRGRIDVTAVENLCRELMAHEQRTSCLRGVERATTTLGAR